jgi:hypothetical protein
MQMRPKIQGSLHIVNNPDDIPANACGSGNDVVPGLVLRHLGYERRHGLLSLWANIAGVKEGLILPS